MELVVARIGRPHGVKGEVTIEIRTDLPEERFKPGSTLSSTSPSFPELTIKSSRVHSGTWLLAFEGIDDRNQAEELRDLLLSADIDVEADGADGSFHMAQLIGAQVFDGERSIGVVDEVIALPGQDLLSVKSEVDEKLIPFVKEFIAEVDTIARIIRVNLPDGL